MAKSARDVAARWAQNLAGSVDKIREGVNAVTVSPTQTAAENVSKYLSGVQNAVSSGRYVEGCMNVSASDWKSAFLSKGLNRIPQGANEAKPKMESFMNEWLPYEENLKNILSDMPRGTLEQNIQRASAAIRYNSEFKYKTKGRRR